MPSPATGILNPKFYRRARNLMDEQIDLDLAGKPSAGEILERIRARSRDESEKGRWFEQLFMRIAMQEPEFEIDGIWRWADWPEREKLTGLDGRAMKVVARHLDASASALQRNQEGLRALAHADRDGECRVVCNVKLFTEGYRTVGRVLRALQAHDGRLAETPATFIRVYEPTQPPKPDVPEGGMLHGTPEN